MPATVLVPYGVEQVILAPSGCRSTVFCNDANRQPSGARCLRNRREEVRASRLGAAEVAVMGPSYRTSGINNFRIFGSLEYGFTSTYPDQTKVHELYLEGVRAMDPDVNAETMHRIWQATADDYRVLPDDYRVLPLVCRGDVWAANPEVVSDWKPVPLDDDYFRFETAMPAGSD